MLTKQHASVGSGLHRERPGLKPAVPAVPHLPGQLSHSRAVTTPSAAPTQQPRTAQPVFTSPVRPTHHKQQTARLTVCAGTGGSSKSLYEVLNVSPSANPREIKSAFRKAALKLHPDVNKAPDAQERFMEAKMAFQTLSDERSRAEYDRKLRMGFGSSRDWSSSSSRTGGASYGGFGGYGARPRQAQPEDNYTFDDLMRDLDREVSNWAKERSGKSKSSQDVPGSLFEELAAVGEEFVEFLEDSLGLKEDGSKASATSNKANGGSGTSSSSSSGSSSSSSKKSGTSDFGLDESAVAAFDKLMEALGLDKEDSTGRQSSSSSSSSSSGSSSGGARSTASQGASTAGSSQQQQSKQDDLDAELAALKRKVGRDK